MGRRGKPVALVLCASAVVLVAGYLLKAPCTSPVHVRAGWATTHDCFSDINRLYPARPAPFRIQSGYKPISEHGVPYRDNNFEYPALTGLFVSVANAAVPTHDPVAYLAASAIGLGILGLLAVFALAGMVASTRRVLLFALAPELIAYAFHNWDLLPVCASVIALWAFARRKDAAAGLALGLGTAAKFYPVMLLPVFAFARWSKRSSEPPPNQSGGEIGNIRDVMLGFAVGFGIPNAIVLSFSSVRAWWFPWKFQSARVPNLETFWAWGYRLARGTTKYPGPDLVSFIQALSLLAIVLAAFILIRLELRRAEFRVATLSMMLVIVYLLFSKFLNPEYMLWVLPFFVLVRLPFSIYGFFVLSDLFELGAVLAAHEGAAHGASLAIFGISVALRYAMLGTLLIVAQRRGSEAITRLAPA